MLFFLFLLTKRCRSNKGPAKDFVLMNQNIPFPDFDLYRYPKQKITDVQKILKIINGGGLLFMDIIISFPSMGTVKAVTGRVHLTVFPFYMWLINWNWFFNNTIINPTLWKSEKPLSLDGNYKSSAREGPLDSLTILICGWEAKFEYPIFTYVNK